MKNLTGIAETTKSFFDREWTVSEKILLVIDCILFGVILGTLFSPKRSKHSMIGCYNSNIEGSEDFEDTEDDEDDDF